MTSRFLATANINYYCYPVADSCGHTITLRKWCDGMREPFIPNLHRKHRELNEWIQNSKRMFSKG